MAKHLSVRLPWHDRGWDGHVCDRPTANVFCAGEYSLKAHGIREGKKDIEEEARRSKPCASLRVEGYRPPCLQTVQTFGGTALLPYQHRPKSFLSTE
jgi:exodeoxyribonuclease V alpha subunit